MSIESFELEVNNGIRSPCNFGDLLAMLGGGLECQQMVHKCIDDKLNLLHPCTTANAHNAIKAEILATYSKTWQFVYCIYHEKCIWWSLSHFYGGADDKNVYTLSS